MNMKVIYYYQYFHISCNELIAMKAFMGTN